MEERLNFVRILLKFHALNNGYLSTANIQQSTPGNKECL